MASAAVRSFETNIHRRYNKQPKCHTTTRAIYLYIYIYNVFAVSSVCVSAIHINMFSLTFVLSYIYINGAPTQFAVR